MTALAAPSAPEVTMTVPMTRDMANFSGNVHGGTLLKLLDQVANACASRTPAASTCRRLRRIGI